MTPIRALFFLAAVSAACAGRIPAKVHQETSSLETQIALLSSQRLVGNPIENGIEKFEELIRRIKERVAALESELIDALEGSTLAIVKKINDLIVRRTGVDLKLDEKWEAFERKTETCTAAFKVSLKDVVVEIKSEVETCAATQIADAKEIGEKILDLVDILKVVPAKTISSIKACNAGPTTPAPPTEAPTTPAPPTEAPTTEAPETESPETETPATLAPATLEPEDDSSTDAPAPVAVQSRQSVRSWKDAWKKAKCVAKALNTAAKELVEVPELLEKVVVDVKDLTSGASRKALENCAVQGVEGKAPLVQEAAAELAYCVIAPSKQ